jgi:hypothetical protein
MRRLVYLGLALISACYDVPKPPCGFRCGPAGECPADYTCAAFEDRCHRVGADPALRCESGSDDTEDAAIDAPVDAAIDAPVDAAIDAPIDGAVDAPSDATDAPTD